MASRESFEETPQNNPALNAENEALREALPIKLSEETTQDSLNPEQLQGIRDECARTALALTAFFDGEAGEVEALLARTHLQECGHCLILQNSWAQQSQMLRGLTVPIPPGLLTRLLTAIRLLSAFPQLNARLQMQDTRFEPKSGAKHDVHLLSESLFVSGANPFAPRRQSGRRTPKIEAPRELPPLDPLSPLPPANLRAEILRRTVGLGAATDGNPLAADSLRVNQESESPREIIVLEPQSKQRQISWRKTRFAKYPTTLVPALAAWLMLLSGQNGLWMPGGESGEGQQESTPASLVVSPQESSKPLSRPLNIKPNGAPSWRANNPVQSNAAVHAEVRETVSPGQLAVRPVLDASGTTENDSIEREVGSTETLQAPLMQDTKKNTLALATAQTLAGTEAPTKPVSLIVPQVAKSQATRPQTMPRGVAKPTIAGLPTERPATPASLPKVTTLAHRADVTEGEFETHTRRASWNKPVSSVPAARRVNWAVANTPVAAPQADSDNIEADAETLEHINRLNDERPDDVRNVLDEYRASLLASNGEDDATLSEPQG